MSKFRASYTVSSGALTGSQYETGPNHSLVNDIRMLGTKLYILTYFNSASTILMRFDTSSQTPGQSYSIISSHGSFMKGNLGNM